jgi:ketosteroid isomerase-like protein
VIYADDAQELLPELAPIVGRDSIRAFYQALLAAHPRWRHELLLERIQVAEAGDLAVVRGTYRAILDTDHPESAAAGKFVGIWAFRDGDWRLSLNISNSDPPAAR